MPSETLDHPRAGEHGAAVFGPELDVSVEAAKGALRRLQKSDGHWVFELEADATIPAEYVLLEHFLDRIDQPSCSDRIGVYLREHPGRAWRLAAVP